MAQADIVDALVKLERHNHDISEVMARVLGDRVGHLDALLDGASPSLGVPHR